MNSNDTKIYTTFLHQWHLRRTSVSAGHLGGKLWSHSAHIHPGHHLCSISSICSTMPHLQLQQIPGKTTQLVAMVSCVIIVWSPLSSLYLATCCFNADRVASRFRVASLCRLNRRLARHIPRHGVWEIATVLPRVLCKHPRFRD